MQGLTGSVHQIEHAYEVTGRGCRISRVRTQRFNMPSRYQVGAAGSHGLGTPNEHAYAVSGRAAGSHGFGTPNRTCLRGIRTGLQDLTGLEQQFQHAYEVSGRGCRISRVRTSDRTCQVGAAESHRLGTADRTCL